MTKIGKIYGGALYELAAEEGLEAQMLEELEQVEQLFAAWPDYEKLLALPSVPKAQRCQALDEALRGRIQPYLLNFLKILTERGQIRALRDCRKEYRARYNAAHGILEATAVAAVPLSEAQKTALTEKLNRLTGKTVQLAVKVDPACLGGVRLEMGGAEFDGTVQARLDALRCSLAATV